MKTLRGIGASDHVAVERIYFLEKVNLDVKEINGCNPSEELVKYKNANIIALHELKELFVKTSEVDLETAQVFDIHQMMLEDLDYVEGVESIIEKGKNVEFAVKTTGDKFQALFATMDDELLNARAYDVMDITSRLIRILKGIKEEEVSISGRFILISEDLLPSDIVRFDHKQIAGFVTKYGSKTSHAAILARTLNLPIVVNLKDRFDEIPHLGMMALNGLTGEVVINPNQYILDIYAKKLQEEKELQVEFEKYRNKSAITKSGHRVLVAANIGSLSDADLVIENDADAVGLFRSEFVYLESKEYPSEEKQFSIYKQVLQKCSPRNVVIRTLDIGADKTCDYFHLEKEENPALGYRAIRICLKEPELFKTQLRALYRASYYGNLSIMFPMITHTEQVAMILEIIEEVKSQLILEGVPMNPVEIGIMIETPAAVMISDKLAGMVDFFSIGTNDLTQYTLAVDRMNSKIEDLFDSGHESVLRMIALATKNAHEKNIWVGICGESASDLALLPFYLDIHIDELSVSPGKVLKLKKAIIESH